MNLNEFNDKMDDTLTQIEDAIDNCDVDLDYENAGGVFTITIESNGSKIIINRQPPLSQLWVAAKSGGYHFNYDETSQTWLNNKDNKELFIALSQFCSEQSDDPIILTSK